MASGLPGDDLVRSSLTKLGNAAADAAGIESPAKEQERLKGISALQKSKIDAVTKAKKDNDKNKVLTANGGKPLSIKDSQWVRQVMFIPQAIPANANARAMHIQKNREFTPGILNFSDTTLGGNRSINPRPQFTEFADQNVDSLLASVTSNTQVSGMPMSNMLNGGMGRYYAESIDAPAQRIYLTMGVPRYNSLGNFFTKYYDNDHGKLANQGIINKAMFYTGKALTWLVAWYIIIPMKMIQMTSDAIKFLARNPPSRYYFVEPTMHLYWMSVNTILSDLMVNMGLLPDFDPENYAEEQSIKSALQKDRETTPTDMKGKLTKEQLQAFRNMVPDLYLDDTGTINAINVATRYQKLANAHRAEFERVMDDLKRKLEAEGGGNIGPKDLYDEIKKVIKEKRKGIMQPTPKKTMEEYILGKVNEGEISRQQELADWKDQNLKAELSVINEDGSLNSSYQDAATQAEAREEINKLREKEKDKLTEEEKKKLDEADAIEKANANASVRDASAQADQETAEDGGKKDTFWSGFMDKFGPTFGAIVDDGMQWASFVVDYESGISESISSSTKSSTIAEAMNATSSSARNLIFNMAGGNIGDNPVANMVETVAGGLKNMLQGVASSIGLSGFSALGGAAFVDIPDFWDSTEASIADASYTIQLRSPYGNTQSLLQNVYFPLCMLLAAALPRSTGKNSYTGPYMVQLWHKGKNQIHTGIITSMNISRGAGNIGWNMRDQAIGIDVSFTIKNLSKVLHMPIKNETGLKDAFGLSLFQEETNFSNYLAILAGLGVYEQYYHVPNLMKQWYMSMHRWDQTFSAPAMASWMVNQNPVGHTMQWFGRETDF